MILENQNGKKVYSDGSELENRMLEIVKKYPEDLSQDFVSNDSSYSINNTFSLVRHNILNWYPFKENSDVLEIGAGMGAITGMLCDKCNSVVAIEMNKLRADIIKTRYKKRTNLTVLSENINYWKTNLKFDYIVFIGVLEYAGVFSNSSNPYEEFLQSAKSLLKENGIILFAIENRFGLKYWCGASEDHLQKPFVGINGYIELNTPKTFSKYELEQIFDNVGLKSRRFYYVLPDYKFPQLIFTDEFLPNYVDLEKIPFTYSKNSLLWTNEKILYKNIIDNKVFDFFSNSYLVELSKTQLPSNHIIYVSARGEGKKKYKIVTTIDNSKNVIKVPAHKSAINHLKKTYDNGEHLRKCGINVLECVFENNRIISKVYDGIKADKAFEHFLEQNDFKSLCDMIDELRKCLLRSSYISNNKENIIIKNNLCDEDLNYGVVLEHGFIDMTFYNAFYSNKKLIFFDQEWCFNDIPLNFIIYYAIKSIYCRLRIKTYIYLENILSYIGINEKEKAVYDKLENYIWSLVLYRQGDVYGADGYCNQYSDELTLKNFIEELNQSILNKTTHIEKLLESERALKGEVSNQNIHIEQLLESERALKGEVSNQNIHIEQLLESERALKGEVSNQNIHIEQLLKSERTLKGEVSNQITHIRQLLESERALKGEVSNQNIHIEQLLESERDLKNSIESLNREKENAILKLRQEEETLVNQLKAENIKISELEKQEKYEFENITIQKNKQISELLQIIKNKEGHIDLLLERDRELERVKNSRSWRYMGHVWHIRDVIIPQGSKRRLAVKITVKFVKSPFRVIRKISPSRIKKFFYYLKREGTQGVSRRIDNCLIGTDIQSKPLDIMSLNEQSNKSISDYEVINFNYETNPTVSIIIPVYNQFDYTYNCLKSIFKNSGNIKYEIIIANDCSSDLTKNIETIVKNIVVINNTENLRFLKNCNNAARYARGKYILFLNNDTQVQENWLFPLVDLMEDDKTIGIVGSKLIYSDGRLQEAGGIIWNDASAWNYGSGCDPNEPEYNYVKEVDYISGASLMTRYNLWNEIGGFDERYIPAYCEDSDFALEVKKKGYKVVYQPLSVVVHFEGISNGRDINIGQKSYQTQNQKKLFEKWEFALNNKDLYLPNANDVFQARDKSIKKNTILMIDHYVPQYDKDAGSRTVFQYLKLFVKMGFNVKFIGDNYYKHEPYTTVLQQLGIEVLYGTYYANNWQKWIKENSKYIDFIFLNRPHISIKYIDFIKQNTNAKIIYYGHDLHFLREKREYDLTYDKDLLNSSENWKNKELYLMKKSDVVYYPSYVEVEEISSLDKNINVKAIPAYIFDKLNVEKYNFDSRKDIMFIGGFGHGPNVDAVKWLAHEIVPHLVKLIEDIRVYILGSNPPDDIKVLASKNIIIKGFVTDEELSSFYKTCRISIVPLRYGAGIKGKVIEAMSYGMPVVTTSVGAEGIKGVDKILLIEDDAKTLAEKIASLYNDEKTLKEMSSMSYRYIERNFMIENALDIIGKDFGL